jgi:hypothetical protein
MESRGLPGMAISRYSRRDHRRCLDALSESFGVSRPKLQWISNDNWSGLFYPGVIQLSTSPYRTGRSPQTLVHEFAHHVMYEWDPHDLLYPHGPEFVGVYGDCLSMAGLLPWHGWQQLCAQYGVLCLDTAQIRTVSGLRRLIKKRAAEAALKTSPRR